MDNSCNDAPVSTDMDPKDRMLVELAIEVGHAREQHSARIKLENENRALKSDLISTQTTAENYKNIYYKADQERDDLKAYIEKLEARLEKAKAPKKGKK